jgi:hypothetical protein
MMSGSYLDAMSDPPFWTSLTGSGKGTGPPCIHRVSAPVATKGHRREMARRRCTHPRVSVTRRRAASWAAPSAHQQQSRVVHPDFGLGHYREPTRRLHTHLRVNVARQRAGQRAAPHLWSAGRRPPALSFSAAACAVARSVSVEKRGGEEVKK